VATIQTERRPFHANLEALRGIAALLVVLHHLSLNPGSVLAAVPLLQQGWLFVDLFFVLSGYVIASAHAESEPTALAARCFLIRRFFRLYPLHLVTLLAALFLDVRCGTARLPGYGAMVAMNLTMTQSWGVVPGSVLNGPSWSISTEWAAYLLFAWICLVISHRRRRIQLLAAIGFASLAALVAWRGASLEGDLIMRVPRCLMSFALGAMIWSWCRNARALAPSLALGLQLTVGAAMLGLLAVAGGRPHLTLLMPLLSGAMIVAMVRDPGSAVRRMLERPVPQWLGHCSYSLYLVHMPLFGLMLLATGGWPAHPAAANLWIAGALGLLLAVTTLTYKFIEEPGRAWGRRIADQRHRRAQPTPADRASVLI
jgi:peptidoglycan/LPS O-acetylase OafA/YrhL